MIKNKVSLCVFFVFSFFTTIIFADDLYKWKDNSGNWVFSSTPPLGDKESQKIKGNKTPSVNNSEVDSDLEKAIEYAPVVVYTAPECSSACKDGLLFLKVNNVPFTEKDVSKLENISEFKKISPDTKVPVIIIGEKKIIGFESVSWGSSLKKSGYKIKK